MWKGPRVDGLTQSLINKFLSCPYRFYLYAILGLEDDLPPHPNLVWGDCYHVGLEHLIPTRDIETAQGKTVDRLKEWKQQELVNKSNLPQLDMYAISTTNMLTLYDLNKMEGDWDTEVVFGPGQEIEGRHRINGTEFIYRGKFDGRRKDAPALAEHKCKGRPDLQLLNEEIRDDLQANLYMKFAEVEWIHYDLIKIPEVQKYGTPAQRVNETDKQYISRLYYGHCGAYQDFPISRNKHAWVNQVKYYHDAEDQHWFWKTTIEPLTLLIDEWYQYVTSPEFDPENPDCYNHLFYRVPVRTFKASNTEKFKCDYHEVLTGKADLDSLRRVDSLYSELEEVV